MTCQGLGRQLRLREKLLMHGAETLSDMELLAAFISSGHSKKSCMHLAHDLLSHLGDIRTVLTADLPAFQQIPGLGTVRYVQLQAVRELCRRSDLIHLQKNGKLTNSQQTYVFLKRCLRDKKNETFSAIFLDSQHHVLAYEKLFTGTIDSATVHPRPIIERVLRLNAAALILAHNHPSGNAEASRHDLAVTDRLRDALALVDVRLLDHLVIGDNEIYSIMSAIKWAC